MSTASAELQGCPEAPLRSSHGAGLSHGRSSPLCTTTASGTGPQGEPLLDLEKGLMGQGRSHACEYIHQVTNVNITSWDKTPSCVSCYDAETDTASPLGYSDQACTTRTPHGETLKKPKMKYFPENTCLDTLKMSVVMKDQQQQRPRNCLV